MYKTKRKVINKYEFSSKLISENEIINIINDEIIEDKEEYLVMNAINTQDKQKINPSLSDKISSIPKSLVNVTIYKAFF